jgi:hypothetical protein
MYEVALGMRDTSRMTPLLDDFRHLGQWLRREWDPPKPADLTVTDYGLCKTKADVADYFDEYGTGMKAGWTGPAVDTESHGSKVWSAQWSTAPHSGRMILAEDRPALQELKMWLTGRTISLHKADADIEPMERLGLIDRRTLKWRDTLQEAYHLCSLPQGLKALAFRLFGAQMRSWQDVVWPASVNVLLKWLADGQAAAKTDLQEAIVTELKRPRCLDCGHQHTKGACKHVHEVAQAYGANVMCGCTSTRHSTQKVEHRPSAIEQILKHVERYTRDTADDDRPYDSWRAISKMRVTGLRGRVPEEFEWAYLEQTLGPMPILGIGNCDLESAVTYGCEDASITGMVAARLMKLRQDAEWKVELADYDV